MIRAATLDDLDHLVRLGERMQAESITRFPPVQRERIARQLEATLANPQAMLAALAMEGDEAVGMVTAVAGDYAFSTERRACSDMLFVVPERRGTTAAVRLARHFEAWAESVGAKTAIMGVSTGVHPERTGALFQQLGYSQIGFTYSKSLGAN